MSKSKLSIMMGGDLSKIKTVSRITSGYTWGQTHTVAINGTLLGLSHGSYLGYGFAAGKATLKNGTTVTVDLSTVNLKNVVNLSFNINSNNSVNGAGVVGVCYLPD